jgi:myosin-7
LRGHIIRLQARSRGYLIRREMTRKKWAVIKIQSNVRRMIAQRDYRRMRVERRARYVFFKILEM